jgi:hypothetical protein
MKTKTTYIPCVQGTELPECRSQRSAENAVKDHIQANGGEQSTPVGGWGGQVVALCKGLRFTVCKIDNKGNVCK